jgi:hypothetical protein
MKLWFLLLWPALVSSTPLAQNTAQADPTPHFLSRVEVHFRLYRNYLIVVQGSLGLSDGLNFLVDTGANPTAVDQRIAKKLGLGGHPKKLDLLDQNVTVEATVLPTLQLGPIRAESLPGIIQDLSPIEKNLGIRIDAIVGFGVLGAESFAIDYKAKKIVFGAIEALPFAVPFDAAPPRLTVPLLVRDQTVRLLLDTGARDVLLFECSLRGRMRELPTHSVKQSSSSKDIPFDTKEALLSEARLGAANLGLMRVLVVSGKQSCGWDFGGVMGMSGLGFRQIGFDFERRIFSFRK